MCERLRFDLRIEADGIQGGGCVFGECEDGDTDEKDQEGENEGAFSLFEQPFNRNRHP